MTMLMLGKISGHDQDMMLGKISGHDNDNDSDDHTDDCDAIDKDQNAAVRTAVLCVCACVVRVCSFSSSVSPTRHAIDKDQNAAVRTKSGRRSCR